MQRIPILFLVVLGVMMMGAAKETATLTVMTHDSFSVSKDVIKAFEQANRVNVRFLKSGDAGAVLNQAILSKRNPMADVLYGVDNTFLSRALKADICEAYASPLLAAIPKALQLDKQNRFLPVDYGDVCLNYDVAWFAKKGIQPPATLLDLTRPAYRSLTVVENPATSSPGLAFLLATIGQFGEKGYLQYWKQLKTNDVLVTDGWQEAYWGQFTAASKGTRPIVVSYASSPAVEVYYASKPPAQAPTAAVIGPGTAFRQIEFVGILKGTRQRDLARRFVDFLLDKTCQEDIPLQMFVFPANRNARLPAVFVKHSKTADKPITIPHQTIAAKREQWIEAWTQAVLR